MLDKSADRFYNQPRVCELQRVLAGYDPAGGCATDGTNPAFLQPDKPIALADLFAALRNHYQARRR